MPVSQLTSSNSDSWQKRLTLRRCHLLIHGHGKILYHSFHCTVYNLQGDTSTLVPSTACCDIQSKIMIILFTVVNTQGDIYTPSLHQQRIIHRLTSTLILSTVPRVSLVSCQHRLIARVITRFPSHRRRLLAHINSDSRGEYLTRIIDLVNQKWVF